MSITFDNFESLLIKNQEHEKEYSNEELLELKKTYNFKWLVEREFGSYVGCIFTDCVHDFEHFNLSNGKKNPHNFGVLEYVINNLQLEISNTGPSSPNSN